MEVRTVALLEGVSDVAAVRAVARARGLDEDRDGFALVDLRGVTNVRAALLRWQAEQPEVRVIGLCDAGEARYAEGALRAAGAWVRDASDLASYGFFVCSPDLEAELIRALGAGRATEVVRDLGLGQKLDSLRQMPAWRDRPLDEVLHRFAGTASGRKEVCARAFAEALTPATTPEPLARLVDELTR